MRSELENNVKKIIFSDFSKYFSANIKGPKLKSKKKYNLHSFMYYFCKLRAYLFWRNRFWFRETVRLLIETFLKPEPVLLFLTETVGTIETESGSFRLASRFALGRLALGRFALVLGVGRLALIR